LKVYSYAFTDDYADYAGLPPNARRDTGILAQDVRDVLPDAVTETDDVTLPTGHVIPDFLVVNKVNSHPCTARDVVGRGEQEVIVLLIFYILGCRNIVRKFCDWNILI